jgi:hypothetical protein
MYHCQCPNQKTVMIDTLVVFLVGAACVTGMACIWFQSQTFAARFLRLTGLIKDQDCEINSRYALDEHIGGCCPGWMEVFVCVPCFTFHLSWITFIYLKMVTGISWLLAFAFIMGWVAAGTLSQTSGNENG